MDFERLMLGSPIRGYVAEALDDRERRILPIGNETVKGISAPIPIYEYRLNDECAGAGGCLEDERPRK